MKRNFIFLILFALFLAMAPIKTQAQIGPIGDWSFEFTEGDEHIYNIPIDDKGEFTVEFEISNSYLVEIEVEITVDAAFNGTLLGDDPMVVSVSSGETKTDDFRIGNIDLFQANSPGGTQDEFRAIATLKTIGGIDVSMTNNWKDDRGDAKMPRIHELRIGEANEILEFNPDIETKFTVEIRNHGNLDDQIGQAEVSDDCSLMTVSIGDESELSKILKPQIKSSSDFAIVTINVDISPTHPTRNCDVDLRVSAGGSGEGDGIVWTESSFRISIKEGEAPPPDDSNDDGPVNQPIVTEQNLPAGGITPILTAILLAFFVGRRN